MTTRAVPLRLRYREVPRLPRLAWVATIDRAAGDVLVFHGSAVECREEWMVEGVWDAEFRSGGFHECPHFFGSGLRLADGCLYCVPSSALVNRLMYCVHRDRVLVANSLALLLAFTGATLAPGHDYRAETYAIRRGVRGYPKAFVVRHPEIASFFQVYDECLVIGSGEPTFDSGRPVRTIASFAAYRALVAEALGRLQDNFLSRYRDTPMQAFSTVSTGYDSAASTVLVKDLDLETCFINVRVASLFARSLRYLVAIALSVEMVPWRLGSDYDRPIPRRIL